MDRTRRIAFLGTSRSGLGHLRRIATIAARLRAAGAGLEPHLVTNARPAGLAAADLAVFGGLTVCPRDGMAAAVAAGGFEMAVVDTMKLPGIGALSCPAVLILREMPDELTEGFRRADGRPWDLVVVPNPAGHWMPRVGRGFARSIEAVGWILRPTGARAADEVSAGIVVATGGGGTEETRSVLYPVLDEVITLARARTTRPFRVRQALGPRAGGAALAEADEVFDPGGDLNAVFRAADVAISTAGYNSVLELASTDTPVLLAAIPRSLDDQAGRVRLWGPRLGHGLEPDQVEEAARWLADQVVRPRRRAPVDLGPDGAARAAELIREVLCPVS